jgi:hypothetical protein
MNVLQFLKMTETIDQSLWHHCCEDLTGHRLCSDSVHETTLKFALYAVIVTVTDWHGSSGFTQLQILCKIMLPYQQLLYTKTIGFWGMMSCTSEIRLLCCWPEGEQTSWQDRKKYACTTRHFWCSETKTSIDNEQKYITEFCNSNYCWLHHTV